MTTQTIGARSWKVDRQSAVVELAAGPVLFAFGVFVAFSIGEVGPFDRAKVQGFIALPLMAIGPGVAGLAGRTSERRSLARNLLRATAVAIGFAAMWATAASVAFVGCRPVTSPIDALPQAAVVGALAAMTYGVAGSAALGAAGRGRRWIAIAIGAGSFVGLAAASVLVIFVSLFPAVSCAAPR